MTASIARKSVTVAEYSLPSGDGKSNKKKRWRWRGEKNEEGKDREGHKGGKDGEAS